VNETARSNAPGIVGDSIGQARMIEILLESITALAAAGEVERACRLAGQACVALRGSDPSASRRFDVLLHRLTPKLTW
jgi:hypothetical protein